MENTQQFFKRVLSLSAPDMSLPAKGKVESTFAIVPALAKNVEPIGQKYAKLQGKFYRAALRALIAKGTTTDKDGKKIEVEDSEDENDNKDAKSATIVDDYDTERKKRGTADRTKDQLCMENLYEILNLDHLDTNDVTEK